MELENCLCGVASRTTRGLAALGKSDFVFFLGMGIGTMMLISCAMMSGLLVGIHFLDASMGGLLGFYLFFFGGNSVNPEDRLSLWLATMPMLTCAILALFIPPWGTAVGCGTLIFWFGMWQIERRSPRFGSNTDWWEEE